jgi:nitrite reductase (NADH) small subunit
MARGIVGTKGDIAKVASPILKQTFNLATGECLDDPSVALATFPIRAVDGRVEIGTT